MNLSYLSKLSGFNKLFLSISLTCAAQMAHAGIWMESGDASDAPSNAQITSGVGALNTIYANLNSATDVDAFKIFINDTANFSISTTGTNLITQTDPQIVENDLMLWVMDTSGKLLFSNDDVDPPQPDANGNISAEDRLPRLNVGDFKNNEAGWYVVAFSPFVTFPIGDPITGWSVEPTPEQMGTVQLNFTGAEYAVPEPGSLALLSIGFGLMLVMRRKHV